MSFVLFPPDRDHCLSLPDSMLWKFCFINFAWFFS
jgi:hypothetical protein